MWHCSTQTQFHLSDSEFHSLPKLELALHSNFLCLEKKHIGNWVEPCTIADRKEDSVVLVKTNTVPQRGQTKSNDIESLEDMSSAILKMFFDSLPQLFTHDETLLDNIIFKLFDFIREKNRQTLPACALIQLDKNFRRNIHSFSSLNAINSDEFFVRIVKPDKTGPLAKDLLEAKHFVVDGLIARVVWKNNFKENICEVSFAIRKKIVLTLIYFVFSKSSKLLKRQAVSIRHTSFMIAPGYRPDPFIFNFL